MNNRNFKRGTTTPRREIQEMPYEQKEATEHLAMFTRLLPRIVVELADGEVNQAISALCMVICQLSIVDATPEEDVHSAIRFHMKIEMERLRGVEKGASPVQ